MTRIPLEPAEENNPHGVGSLTDAEVSEFSAAVDHLRSVIPTAFGLEWNDAVFSGDGYVVTEMQRGSSGYFSGYRGVRKTSNGFAVMSGDERRYEGASVTFSRFEDAVKGYATEVIGSFRMHLSGRYLGYVAWMWNGTTGPGVVAQPLNRSNTEFHYSLENDPSIWLEGRTTAATLSHGLGMSIPAFIAAVIAHPKVTGKDATAWPKPVQP